MARKVLPLVGFKSLRALNAFSALILGVKMLPAYQHYGYEEFLLVVENMPEEDQRNIFLEAARFVELQPEEVNAMVCFCTDKNGIPYTQENLKNLGPADLIEVITAVCMEMVKIKVDFVSDLEKKN